MEALLREIEIRTEISLMEEITEKQRVRITKKYFASPPRGWPMDTKKRALIAIKWAKTEFRTPSDAGELKDLRGNIRRIANKFYKEDKEVMAKLKGL